VRVFAAAKCENVFICMINIHGDRVEQAVTFNNEAKWMSRSCS